MISEKRQQTVTQSLVPAARTTSANGTGVDLANTNSVTVTWNVGAITDGTHTPTVEESDASGSGYTTVAAGDLDGTLAALVASTPQSVAYMGTKRYVRAVITVTGSPSTGGVYGANVLTRHARKQP